MNKRNRQIRSLLVLIVVSLGGMMQGDAATRTLDYSLYAKLLQTYVSEDRVIKGIRLNVVDYEGLSKEARDDSSAYRRYLTEIARFDPESLPSRESQIAFWINAYNIGAIKMILDHYPVDSIRSMKINFFTNPWDKDILNVHGRMYSLGAIEHEILLGKYGELMAHFGIVCASLSCPEIIREVYREHNVMRLLRRQARKFINDPRKGLLVDRQDNRVSVSRIFKFDSKNFSEGTAVIVPFIMPFVADEGVREYLRSGRYKLDFLDYDWDLNSLKSVQE